MDVWYNHFSRLLGGADESFCGDGSNGTKESDSNNQDIVDFSNCLGSPFSPEEVHWALDKMKKDAAPGQAGVVAEMMMADCLFDVYLALFLVCWEYGIVPSVRKESLVVPVTKKKAKVCVM